MISHTVATRAGSQPGQFFHCHEQNQNLHPRAALRRIGAVIIQNRATVNVVVLFTSFELPLIVLLGVTALAGFVVGLLVAALSKSRPNKSD